MNDFTKDELKQLMSNILNMRLYTDIDIWDGNLLIKIQSLIDNHCEHKNTFECYTCQIETCNKCGNKIC